MKATFKAELRKLLTVRSTYIVTALALIIVVLVGFYIEGYKGISGSPASTMSSQAISEIIVNTATTAGGFAAIVAILFMVHEYRHNTITYTLTAANSRSKVLLAKMLTITLYTVIFTFVCLLLGLASYYAGLALRNASLPAQDLNLLAILGRVFYYNVAYGLIGLLLGALLRNIAAASVLLFMVPSTVEPLIGLLIKERAVYLPFSALEKVISSGEEPTLVRGSLTPSKAILVTLVYISIGWLITWLLFLRRDAN